MRPASRDLLYFMVGDFMDIPVAFFVAVGIAVRPFCVIALCCLSFDDLAGDKWVVLIFHSAGGRSCD